MISKYTKKASASSSVALPDVGDDFMDQFENPPAELRGKPFWSWNGDLDKDELIRQIGIAKEMGMGGVFMHSRTGLKTEYLGEEWFELINACAEQCAQNGLEGWLYDEDRWPSGSAGGIVTQDLKYRMRSIVLTTYAEGDAIAWPEPEDFIEAHWVELEDLHLSAYTPVDYAACDTCSAGKQLHLYAREIHSSNSFYNDGAYLNTLDREATDAFIKSTHEKYREQCGAYFGNAIKGIFTDEPHRGFILCDAVEQPGASRTSHAIPYADDLFEAFEVAFGQSLKGRLPELFFQYKGARLSSLKWQYMELLQRLFIKNWAQPCADWCEANDLLLTGHVLHEDTLAAQAVPVGSLFRYYETMSYPGIDVLSQRCESFWIAKQVVSSTRQLGKHFALSEMYGGTGWDMGFDGHKRIGDWQAFQGINLRCPHLSWYSMAGESKRDYPASVLHQSAWYSEYKYVEDYFSRINCVLQQGDPDCDVLVVHPGESLWAQFHLGWAKWLGSDSAQIDVLEERFTTLYHWIVGAQIDFDYGDEEQMLRLGAIEVIDDEVFFRLGQMRYRSIVLGGMDTLRGTTLKLLQDFSAAGGSVVFAGPCPEYLDAEPSAAPLEFAQQIGSYDWSQSAIVGSLRGVTEQLLKLNDGQGVAGVLSHVRRLENGNVCVALVNTREEAINHVAVQLSAVGQVERLNCRDGSVAKIPTRSSGEGLLWNLDFAPLEEHVFRINVNSLTEGSALDETKTPYEQSARLEGPFAFELSEPNVLMMDRPRFKCGDGEWQAAEEVLRVDNRIRELLDWPLRTGTMVQAWCSDEAPVAGPDLELEFSFDIEVIPPALELVLEQPDRWEIAINGQSITNPEAPESWMDIALKRLPLAVESLQVGCNTLSLRTKLRSDTDLEAVYLLGDFGVTQRGDGFTMGTLPEQLVLGDLVDQGLVFYSGAVSYLTQLPQIDEGHAFVCELSEFAAACVSIRESTHEAIVAFPPYRADFMASAANPTLRIDVTLTRQNLFGPFHRLPKESVITAPSSFRTVGAEYTEGYEFFPSGLLEAPVIRY
jgi:hypothetical protein